MCLCLNTLYKKTPLTYKQDQILILIAANRLVV